MAVDAVAERLSAANDIRNAPGVLVTVRQPTYTGDARTGQNDVKTYAIIESVAPRFMVSDTAVLGTEVLLTMAALEWDEAAAAWKATVVNVGNQDKVLVDGQWLSVLLPGKVNPTGDVIVYDGLRAGLVKESQG